jgi:hypothetical protein
MRSSVVMIQNNSICHHSSKFVANSGFQLHFKHSAISCTTDHLPTILAVLEDGSVKVPNCVNITFPVEDTLLNSLIMVEDRCFHSMLRRFLAGSFRSNHALSPVTIHCTKASTKIACKFPRVTVCAHL